VSPAKKPAAAAKRGAKIGYYAFIDAPPDPLPPLIVITGKEHLLAAGVLHLILEKAVPDESTRQLNVDAVDGTDDAGVGEIAAKARALPFLAERRVVIVRGTIDLKADDRRALAAACADLPEHAVIIVDHSGTPARPQGRKPVEEALELAASTAGGIAVECNLDAKARERFINEVAATAGVQVSADARATLALSESAAEIRSVIERLALTADAKKITLEMVKGAIQSFDDVKLWDFTAAVHEGDADRALRLLRDVLAKPDDVVGPLFALAADAIAIWELKFSSSQAYAAASGQNAWRLSKLQDAARSLTPENAGRAVTLTARALDHLFSGRREGGVLLDEVVVRLCDMRRARASRQ
jgi:DNA polymerase III delta subunit